jgi:cytochrome oxidase Cu insertion factor (SCO1/SenC/PrrC family)
VSWPRERVASLIALAALVGVIVGVIAHFAFGTTRSAAGLELPLLHGQVSWTPGERAAPGFRLRDTRGNEVSLAAQRGRVVILAFLSSDSAGTGVREARLLAGVESQLDGARAPLIDVVSLDPMRDSASRVAALAATVGLLRSTLHWLVGPARALRTVWREFGIGVAGRSSASSAIYLIDGSGFERTGYLYPFQPGFVARDVRTLAQSN